MPPPFPSGYIDTEEVKRIRKAAVKRLLKSKMDELESCPARLPTRRARLENEVAELAAEVME
ncbi:hypothetical protein [Paraburkholderia unamae]|uniref:Uncharacterized protein n=1 Tax=Paraburkholderia unamae TaxID=219649 RepID=A0ACC6RGM1_9BURK